MINDWKQNKISDFLLRKKDQIFIDDKKIYKRLTIKMHNKGICVRDEIVGSRIGTKNQFTVKSGWLLLSKIDARNGAFGIIPSEADGGIITGNFWAYELDLAKIDPQFFFYFSHSQKFLDFCIASSQGATNRRYLQEELFLNREILLPPLPEQKRIVKKIKEIEGVYQKIKVESDKQKEISKSILDEYSFKLNTNLLKRIDFDKCLDKNKFSVGKIKKNEYLLKGKFPVIDQGQEDIAGFSNNDSLLYTGNLPTILFGDHTKVYKFAREKFVLGADGVKILNFRKDIFIPKFIFYILKSIKFKGRDYSRNYKQLKTHDLPLITIEDQKVLLHEIENLDSLVSKISREFVERESYLLALMPSALSKAFNGEL